MFCSNCGNKLNEGANFCDKCGAKVVSVTDVSQNPCASPESVDSPVLLGEEPQGSVLQFIRGIPFGLFFLTLLMPLFVISCRDASTSIDGFTAYQSLDFSAALSDLLKYIPMGEIAIVKETLQNFTYAVVSVLILASLAFGFSFFTRAVAAMFGNVYFLSQIPLRG